MAKEELEKEAEEYATHNDWFEFSANVDKIGNAIRTKIERAYIAGAEFGYNKAKEDAATLIRANNDTVTTLMQLNNMLVSKNQQLTKAKELLERLLITSCNSDVLNLLPNCSEVLRVRVEAEQFLSEVEK